MLIQLFDVDSHIWMFGPAWQLCEATSTE